MFAFIYLELVKKFMGERSYTILKTGYKNFNVKYRNEIPQTSAKRRFCVKELNTIFITMKTIFDKNPKHLDCVSGVCEHTSHQFNSLYLLVIPVIVLGYIALRKHIRS